MKRKNILFVIVYILSALQFYLYYKFSPRIEKLPILLLNPFLFFFVWSEIKKKVGGISRLLKIYLVSILITIVVAYFSRNQSFFLSYRAISFQFIFLLYFYLKKKKFCITDIERIILFFGFLYVILWIYAYMKIPALIFGVGDDGEIGANMSRGMARLRFPGKAFLVMSFFICLNKFKREKRKNYLLLSILFYVFIFFQLVRQFILWTTLIALVSFLDKKKIIKGIATILVISIAFIKISENNVVVSSLIEMSKEEIKTNRSGETNIRILQYEFFFTSWAENLIEELLGTGYPHADSNFGKMYYSKIASEQMYLSDVGYASIKAVLGYSGLFIYLLLTMYALKQKIPEINKYAHLFLWFALLANIGAEWYNQPDFVVLMSISLYIIDLNKNSKKKWKNDRNNIDCNSMHE